MKRKVKGVLYTTLFASLILLVMCYLWFSCREFCSGIIITHKPIIMQYVFEYLKKIGIILLLFIFFKVIQNILINNLIKKIMQKLGSREKYKSITKIFNFSLWTLFVFITISILIGNITGFLASLGLIGFGLTFALQKPILNFVGWLIIIFKGIYHEGDRIKINTVIGDVKEIQIMNTIVEGLLESSDVLSGKTISFPNELILTTDIQNYTKDSNYIVNELSISITYESDYHLAMKILKDIILAQVSKNKKKYVKKIASKKLHLSMAVPWIKTDTVQNLNKPQNHEQSDNITNELKSLEEEFIPLIRIEMLDSAIQLIAQFKSPYNEIKQIRTAINIAFLDTIKDHPNIEVAYPHLQIIK